MLISTVGKLLYELFITLIRSKWFFFSLLSIFTLIVWQEWQAYQERTFLVLSIFFKEGEVFPVLWQQRGIRAKILTDYYFFYNSMEWFFFPLPKADVALYKCSQIGAPWLCKRPARGGKQQNSLLLLYSPPFFCIFQTSAWKNLWRI